MTMISLPASLPLCLTTTKPYEMTHLQKQNHVPMLDGGWSASKTSLLCTSGPSVNNIWKGYQNCIGEFQFSVTFLGGVKEHRPHNKIQFCVMLGHVLKENRIYRRSFISWMHIVNIFIIYKLHIDLWKYQIYTCNGKKVSIWQNLEWMKPRIRKS